MESSPGEGSVFKVYLPIYQGQAQSKQASHHEGAILCGYETVLLADDEPNLLMMTRKMLERYGYTVLTAHNGVEMLEAFEAHCDAIQVVITDLIMPRMSGLEAIKRIRQCKEDLPAIVMSGYTDNLMDEASIAALGAVFLPKPIHFKKLTETIRTVLGPVKTPPPLLAASPEQGPRKSSGDLDLNRTDKVLPATLSHGTDPVALDWLLSPKGL